MSDSVSQNTDTGTGGPRPGWDAGAYAANTGHHRHYDDWFLAGTPLAAGQDLLDLGCGSGDFTRTLAGLVGDGGTVTGLDAQAGMVEAAASCAAPNQAFVVAAAQELGRALAGRSFDGVVSRAVLHWVPTPDWPGVLGSLRRVLRPGGWLRVECGGTGNVPAVRRVLDEESSARGGPRTPWWFHDAGWALERLEEAGFHAASGHVRTVAQRRAFDRASLLGWLRSQCFQAYEVGLPAGAHDAFRRAVEDRLDDLRRPDGTHDQTFVRLDLLVHVSA
jgi:ubiquinone/menaquinone biosynthesis C-methylase UbiE